jgi:predicted DNA-binding protein with PD1-like motif
LCLKFATQNSWKRSPSNQPQQGISYAAIVALAGAVNSFTVSTPPYGDPTSHTYKRYPLPAEMTATGEIVDGKPHVHAVMAVQGDRTIGGLLHSTQVGSSLACAYVMPSDHRVAIQANEKIVFAAVPDIPPRRGRLSDTRVTPSKRGSRPHTCITQTAQERE